jgi:CubicO group peptidase (beta-lactamase class C family)
MQLRSAVGTLTLRAHNNGATATDPILLYANDRNGLMRRTTPVKVGTVPPHGTRDVPLLVNAVLPPAQSQMPDDQQYSQWTKSYAEKCGVAMQPIMNLDMSAPNAKDLMSTHAEGPVLYRGVGSSPSITMTKPEAPYCDKARCVLLSDVAKNISSQLDSKVVGYAYFLGGCFSTSGAAGKARLMRRFPLDLTPVNFFTTTKMTVASVSKVITALAAIKVIAERQKSDPNLKHGLDSPIGPYLPPWNWGNGEAVASITFRDLLAQSSGIRNHGNFDMNLSNLKKYFSKPVVASGACVQDDKASDIDGADPASITTDKSYCYSNLNFAIFRILLPRIMGYGGDDEDTYAALYVQIVQDRVFKPLGIMDADCKPNDDSYAFAYQMGGDILGKDFGNRRPYCGGEGWYLSVEDLGLLLMSLNGADGRILAESQFHDMEMNPKHALGWDCPRDGACPSSSSYRWVTKDGELKSGDNRVTTSIGIFGSTSEPAKNKPPLPPDPYVPGAVGVLFINSDVAGAPGMAASGVLKQAFDQAAMQAAAKGIKPKPSLLGDQR